MKTKLRTLGLFTLGMLLHGSAGAQSTPAAKPLTQTRPVVVQTEQIRTIRARPAPVTVQPIQVAIKRPVFVVDNKPTVDLRDEAKTLGVYPVRNQGSRGTCSVFAMTFLLDFMYAKHFDMKNADFSEEFLNLASNLAIGEMKDGGFFDAIDLGYQKYGDVSEALAPYKSSFDPNLTYPANVMNQAASLKPRFKAHFIKEWNVGTGLLPSQLFAIIFQLKNGRPVAAGLRWPKPGKFKTDEILGVTMMTAPPPSDVVDGHSIVFVGYKVSDKFPGGGYLVFRNSWGSGFMEDGYGYMSFDYANKYTNDAIEYVLP
jgi:C1A family cysteine protease